jgi:hypothetical protein
LKAGAATRSADTSALDRTAPDGTRQRGGSVVGMKKLLILAILIALGVVASKKLKEV